MRLLKTSVAGNTARQSLLIAESQVLLYDVKRYLAANEAHFWDGCRNMGHFLCGVEWVKPYGNAHLHCIVSSLKWARQNVDFADHWKNFCGRLCLCCLCL